MFKMIKTDICKKDIDISVALNVTPATVGNWQYSKSLPYNKDIKKISKYFFVELKYKHINISDHLDKYISEVKEMLPTNTLNDILKAKNNAEYSKLISLILNSLCEEDRKDRNSKMGNNDIYCEEEDCETRITEIDSMDLINTDNCNVLNNTVWKNVDVYNNEEMSQNRLLLSTGRLKKLYLFGSILGIIIIGTILLIIINSNKMPNSKTEEVNKDITNGGSNYQDEISVIYQTFDDVKKVFLPNVIDRQDYAGNWRHDIDCIYANLSKGNITYKVHVKDDKWLPEVTNRNDYAGIIGKPIDGLMMKTDTDKTLKYRVHLRRTNRWLPYVTGYDENNFDNGYAGILGQEIDAIQIYLE